MKHKYIFLNRLLKVENIIEITQAQKFCLLWEITILLVDIQEKF